MGMNKRIVVVLGMHRSGTSALTRGLSVLGVELGDNLMDAVPGQNDKGYWEDLDVVEFNDSLLAKLGSSWHDVNPLDWEALSVEELTRCQSAAKELLKKKLKDCVAFGFKDPRTAILLPFWKDVFNSLGLDVSYLVSLRNPASVADSLNRCHGFKDDISYLLWIKYMLCSLCNIEGKSIVVDYDDLLDSPEEQLKRISNVLKLGNLADNQEELIVYSQEFLESSLQHFRCHVEALKEIENIPPLATVLFEWLLTLAQCQNSLGMVSKQKLTQFETEYYELTRIHTSLFNYDVVVAERDNALRELEATNANRDSLQKELQATIDNRDSITRALDTVLADKVSLEKEVEALVANRDSLAEERERLVSLLVTISAERDTLVAERDAAIAGCHKLEANRTSLLNELSAVQANRDSLNNELTATKANRDALQKEREVLLRQLEQVSSELSLIVNSKSWLITWPIRAFKKYLIVTPYQWARLFCSRFVRSVWHCLPMSVGKRHAVKGYVFKAFPRLFRNTKAYHDWTVFTGEGHSPENESAPEKIQVDQNVCDDGVKVDDSQKSGSIVCQESTTLPDERELLTPVPLLELDPIKDLAVRMIAFYLPQFHPIPENNKWWGEGFTEWTNVKPAVPQFAGHYQPHLPHELGYYDLRNIEVQKRQIDLAKLYGISGFCFYFYWFAGKRLLETPVLNYLNNSELDHPFCLCWANENWTRRWDGLENDILIDQNYSKDDDLAFIEYVSQYLKDRRYIRINGKPVLLIYRPSLLPSIKKTANFWRTWCRENGVGEIFLAYPQSFESVDPANYGFDAAIEFPPNNTAPPEVSNLVPNRNGDFSGHIYDWSVFVERSHRYKKPPYKLFRGVNPGWDNTARKKQYGTIFVNSEPRGYQQWLYNAVQDTLERFEDPEERIVFVNAWNEWAEGAHLEPDQRYGYAYLEANRMALVRAKIKYDLRQAVDDKALTPIPDDRLAVIIHAFYPDVLKDIMDYVAEMVCEKKVYITVPHEKVSQVEHVVGSFPHIDCFVLEVNNHGRDILPFLKIIEHVRSDGYELFVKVHTKKSKHREDGEVWRDDLYQKLLVKENLPKILACFANQPNVGMVGPAGHIVSMNTYWGSNKETVLELAARIGCTPSVVMTQPFVAGSMFYCRLSALGPLLNLAIRDKDFETEAGQVDGTMAHAIERVLSISVRSAGMSLVSTGNICSEDVEAAGVNENYEFAEKVI